MSVKVRCDAHSAWHSGGRINFGEVVEISEEDAMTLIENGLVTEVTDRQLEIEAKAAAEGRGRKRKDPAHA